MRPEASRWPPIERLLARLPADVPVRMLERKRLELVLAAAEVPEEPEGFGAWVERDPQRLARMVAAVVGVAASHGAVVRGVVSEWWELERARRKSGGWDEEWGRGAGGAGGGAGGGRRKGRAWWGVAVLVVGLVVGLVVVAGPRVKEWLGLGGEGGGGEVAQVDADTGAEASAGAGAGAGASASASAEALNESSGGSSGDEVEPPPSPEPQVEIPSLEGKMVRVAVPKLDVVPGEVTIPWSAIVVVAFAAAGLVVLLRAKPPVIPLPAPPEHGPRPTRWGRQPPRGPLQRRILLDRGDRDALVWGIAREAVDRPTEDVDVPRSVDATIESGIPTLWFEPASEYHGVWIWRDTTLGEPMSLALRLERELAGTLRDAGLPVQVATFEGVPSVLALGSRTLAASSLLGVGRPPRVVVLTDGLRLARRLADDDERERTEQLLRALRRWEGLALVDFDGPRSELAVLARAWGLRRITPDQAAAHLAGQASRVEHPAPPRELERWEVACVVAPRSIDESEAQRVRRALDLGASAFDIEALRERADGGHGQSRLEWSRRARAEIFDRFERAYGYLGEWEQRRGGARLLVRAVEHWVKVYDQAIAARVEADTADTAAHLGLERALVRLWTAPNEAARVLYAWWQTQALRGTVAELVSRYADAEGGYVDAAGRPVRVRLPWRVGALEVEAQRMLVDMGLAVRQREVRARRGGRWALGIGVVGGIGVAGVGYGVGEVMRPRVEVVGKVPEGATVECAAAGWLGRRVECVASSRHWVEVLGSEEIEIEEEVAVSWAMEERACEGAWGEGGRYVMCDRKGRLARQEAGVGAWSRAVVGSGGEGRVLAQALLDSGSADVVVMGALGAEAGRVLDGEGQRIVILGEAGEEALDGLGLVVRVPEGSLPSLDFVGTKDVREGWPGVAVVQGEGERFELRGVLTPTCPAGMVYIAGGAFEGKGIEGFCLDVTEVTVAAYGKCFQSGVCTAGDEMEHCNWGRADRSSHPINCVNWQQATTYCEASGGRLPTSEEWEWAARGREDGRTYPWGGERPTCQRVVMVESASPDDNRWGCDTGATWPVGSKPKGDSKDGVKDMAGNIWEWTSSQEEERRVVRGGGWRIFFPVDFRASSRNSLHPAYRSNGVGFRCARTSGSSK